MGQYRTPGVYLQEAFAAAAPGLRTGVPAFIGHAQRGPGPEVAATGDPETLRVAGLEQFTARFGEPVPGGYLADAVEGFFANGGDHAYVLRLADESDAVAAHREALGVLELLAGVDIVCAPDALRGPAGAEIQRLVLGACDALGTAMAILDAPMGVPIDGPAETTVLAHRRALVGTNGALYHPWVAGPRRRFVPPCGHVAGVIARTDRRVGVHKAPANEVVEGVLDLAAPVGADESALLNEQGVNAIRAFRGRGIRVWGARTLSAAPEWRYLSVRRVVLTIARWAATALPEVAFEPNRDALWEHMRLRISRGLGELYDAGALLGTTPEEAFSVRCDATTNPPEVRDAGLVVAEVALAPARPHEFVVLHITRAPGGVSITGPAPG